MAAILACGDEAALSHRSAAALWGIGTELTGQVDLSVRRRCSLGQPGLKVRGRPSLRAEEIVERMGIPVTSVVQTGVKRLAVLLDKRTFRLPDSELERLFRPIAAASGCPVELTRERVNGDEVDFCWPSLGMVVETDGLKYHRTPAAQARDRVRDQTHTAAGLAQLRFTHWQVAREAGYVRGILARTASRLRR